MSDRNKRNKIGRIINNLKINIIKRKISIIDIIDIESLYFNS
jgi:hypothetical protein